MMVARMRRKAYPLTSAEGPRCMNDKLFEVHRKWEDMLENERSYGNLAYYFAEDEAESRASINRVQLIEQFLLDLDELKREL